MNKKEIVTQKNIMKVADFLESACKHFKNNGEGCYHYQLDSDLEIAVGWSDGYDPSDNDIIKGEKTSSRTCCAVNAGVVIANVYETDFDYLNYPWDATGEVWDNGISMKPDYTRKNYRRCAKWFLNTYVDLVNIHNKGKCYFYKEEEA